MKFSTRPKYTLRKLTIGLVSVFFGTVVIAVSRHAHAAVVDPDQDKQGLVVTNTAEASGSIETTPEVEESSIPSTSKTTEFDGTKEEAPPAEGVEVTTQADQIETSTAPVDSTEAKSIETTKKAAEESTNIEEPATEVNAEKATENVEKSSETAAKVRAKRATTNDTNQVVDQINWDAVLYERDGKDVKITDWNLSAGGYDVLLPNTWDFQQKGIIGQDGVAKIRSYDMHDIFITTNKRKPHSAPEQEITITISHNNDSKLVASDENWYSVFHDPLMGTNGYYANTTSIDLNSLDTSNITNSEAMFYDLKYLKSLKIDKWNTSNLKNARSMFYGLESLSELDVSNWDTSNLENASEMFYGMSSLTKLDVSKWDTHSLSGAYMMFMGVSSLTKLDVSNWNTSNLMFTAAMFNYMTNLTELDVSKWDTHNISNAMHMFADMPGITTVMSY